MLFFLLLPSLLISISYGAALSIQEKWSAISNPLIMGKNFETRFFALPPRARVRNNKRFWSGDYWPLNNGNINRRWYSPKDISGKSPNRDQAKLMSRIELARLSPAEKFDLLNGRYDYPLKQSVTKISDVNAKDWEGICHGWAPAAINHNEPTPKTLINPDGVMVPFGSSDIKGILSYYYAYPYQVPDTHQLGRRCYDSRMTRHNNCRQDLNAGAFHIILSNKIAIENEGFIADIKRFKEVWNHPIMGYETRILYDRHGARSNSASGTKRTVKVKTIIRYADETQNYWRPVLGTELQKFDSTEFSYFLEIDSYGQIIGGEWSSIQRPDFLWIKARSTQFMNDFKRLPELLND